MIFITWHAKKKKNLKCVGSHFPFSCAHCADLSVFYCSIGPLWRYPIFETRKCWNTSHDRNASWRLHAHEACRTYFQKTGLALAFLMFSSMNRTHEALNMSCKFFSFFFNPLCFKSVADMKAVISEALKMTYRWTDHLPMLVQHANKVTFNCTYVNWFLTPS